MTYRMWPALAILALACATLAGAEDTKKYTIKVKELAPGDRELRDSTNTEETSTKILGPDGTALQDKTERTVTTQKYTETILERPRGKPATKLRRAYAKVEVKTGDTTTSPPFQGKTVRIEKQKDGKYHFFIEGGAELTGKDAALLAKEFNRKNKEESATLDKLMLPGKPVALNESWKIDTKKVVEYLGELPIDADKAKGTGKLVKVYRKNGHQFGVLEYQFDMPLRGELGPEGKKIPIQPGAKLTARATIDGCIDGSVTDASYEAQFNVNLTGILKANNMELKLILASKTTEKKRGAELPRQKK